MASLLDLGYIEPVSTFGKKGTPFDPLVLSYDFDFAIDNTKDLIVLFDGLEADPAWGYSWTFTPAVGVGKQGGTITFNKALDSALFDTFQVRRRTSFIRTVKYSDNGDLLAATVNGDFDRLWFCLQEQRAASDGALSRPVGAKHWDALDLPLLNLPDATTASEPVTLGQMQGWTQNAQHAADTAYNNAISANTSELNALKSEMSASQSAREAQDAANKAGTDAANAANALIKPHADAAAISERNAEQYAQNAGKSEIAAGISEANAAASAAAAKLSEQNAGQSEVNAKDYAEHARLSAIDAAASSPASSLTKIANLSDLDNVAEARKNLGLDKLANVQIQQQGRETEIYDPMGSSYLYIADSAWGAFDTNTNKPLLLGVTEGGTGVSSYAELLAKLNVPTPDVTPLLRKDDNLAALTDKDAARTTLGAAAATEVYTKTEIDALVKKFGSGGYIGEVFWHPMRDKLPAGTVPADGQTLATPTYPDLTAEVKAGNLPTTTEAIWISDPSKRGCYVLDEAAKLLRVPDYNGKLNDSYPAPFMRGDAAVMTPGMMQENAAPNITGTIEGYSILGKLASNSNKNPFKVSRAVTNNYGPNNATAEYGSYLEFDASRANPAYGRNGISEVLPNAIVGCYVIRVATEAQTGGNVDMMSLQADFAQLQSSVETLNGNIGHTILDAGTMGTNQRKLLVNPFGVNVPVMLMAEVQTKNAAGALVWTATGWIYNSGTPNSYGTRAVYVEGEGIYVQTGTAEILNVPTNTGAAYGGSVKSGPVRVHVWSMGSDLRRLKQISAIDPALIAEFKTTPARPIDNQAIYSAADAAMVANTRIDLPADLRGTTIYIKLGTNTYYTPCLIPFLDDDSDFMFIANPTQSVVFTLKVGGTALVTKQFESGVRAVTGIRIPVFKQP